MGRKKNKNNTAESEKNAGNVNFVWTDDEVELLLGVIIHFKAEKEAEGYDWESVKTKYESIIESFVKSYPKESSEKFPKTSPEKEFTKSRILTKVKAIRLKYRKAVDSGKKSGGGRVVATFYDSCQNIWGGSPAAEMIDNGIETSDILSQDPVIDNLDERYLNQEEDEAEDQGQAGTGEEATSTNPLKRRNLIDHIVNQRNSKLLKKIPVEKVMLDVAKEDVALKKEIFAEMKKSDKEQSDQLRILNDTMLNLTKSINEGIQALNHNVPPAGMQNYQLSPPPDPSCSGHSSVSQSNYHNSGYMNALAMQRQSNTYNFYTDS